MHPGRCGRDVGNIIDALGGLQDGMDQDGLGDRMSRFQLGEKLVEVVDVPRSLHLRQRVHRPVAPKSLAWAMAMKPARAAVLASAGIASSRLPSTTST